MKYLSVCSGIEAATQAWHSLGWSPVAFSEIEKFPAAVLAHHYPDVPNLGDMTKFKEWPDYAIDLLVGGTPCQSFSVAGLRKGLDDPRGNLALVYLGIVDRYRPARIVWENVPGVLSVDQGRAFGSFLGGLEQLGYGWAYRTLDAQYIRVDTHPWAVPQRRRRVFVVGYLGDWRRAAAVLFEPESLRGDPAPRREAGQGIAPTISARPTGGGGLGTDFDCDGGLIAAYGGNDTRGSIDDVATAVNAHGGPHGRQDFESETFVAHSLRAEGFDASEDGTGRGTPIVPVAFSCKDSGQDATGDGSTPTLRAMGHDGSHANAGGQLAIAIQERAVSENPDNGPDGAGFRQDGTAYTLEARTVTQAVFDPNQITSKANGSIPTPELCHTLPATDNSPVAFGGTAVRRLTPRECERLQGFPDDFTLIPYRGKDADQCPDGPRYKALGNSFAVNVIRWIGLRIKMVEEITKDSGRADMA